MFTISSNDPPNAEWNDTSSNTLLGGSIFNLDDYDAYTNASQELLQDNRTRCPDSKRFRPPYPGSSTRATVLTLSYYTCPAILAIGVFSNLLAYLVFTRTRLRKVPSVPYLAAMAVADSGALITEFIMVPLLQHRVFFITKAGVCQYVSYLNYMFVFLCMWYPVALSVEKFITVYYPTRRAGLCTPFRAKVVVIAMAILAGVCYYYVIYMFGPQKHTFFGQICGAWEEFHEHYNLLMKLDSIFVNVLPFIVLISLMVLICGRGCEYYRISSAGDVNHLHHHHHHRGRHRAGPSSASSVLPSSADSPARVTNVVFPVVIIMLLFKLPTCIMRFAGLVSTGPPQQVTIDLQPVFLYASRLDWAVKLYVYLTFSPSFRGSFNSFFSSTCHKFKKLFSTHAKKQQTTDDDSEANSPCINLADRNEANGEAAAPARMMTSADV